MSTRDGNPEIYVDEPRRLERAAAHATSRHRHRRRPGRRPATRSPSPRTAPARRRSTSSAPTAWASRSASPPTSRTPTARPGRRRRSTRSPTPRAGPGLRHQDLRPRHRHRCGSSPSAKAPTRARRSRRTAGTSRSPRPALGNAADLHRRPRRQGLEADHEGRQQLQAELVALAGDRRFDGDASRPCDAIADHRRCSSRIALPPAVAGARARRSRPIARPTPPPPRQRHARRPAAGAARAGRRAAPGAGAARAGRLERSTSGSLDDLNKNSPLAAGVLRVRQRRDEQPTARRCWPRTPRR